MEVERSLRVLDGGVVVLDGSAGVEAQTMTVWRQADRHQVPRIAFVNKMDKLNASLAGSLDSIRSKLKVEPLLVQLPQGGGKEGEKLRGVVDLVRMCSYHWTEKSMKEKWGKDFETVQLEGEVREKALKERTVLIDKLCECDDELAEILLARESYESIGPGDVISALRRVTLGGRGDVLVTLCGSAYKNVGVQPLMDAVVDYLPSPCEVNSPTSSSLSYHEDSAAAASLCALAFKTIHHEHRGALTFVRVYRGALMEGEALYNMSQEVPEKVAGLMVAFADDFKSVKAVGEGNIAVVSGLKSTVTGDTLVAGPKAAKDAIAKWEEERDKGETGGDSLALASTSSPYLSGVSVPSPVFYCSVEPPSMRYQQRLELALERLAREDPSLRVSVDENTGQTVLSGMGDLHLEIVADRIRKEYNVDVDLGPLLIAYKESPLGPSRVEVPFKRQMMGKSHEVNMALSVEPMTDTKEAGEGGIDFSLSKASQDLRDVPWWQIKEVRRGVENAVNEGPLLGCPVANCHFVLHSLSASRGAPPSLLSAAGAAAAGEALRTAGARLLEPVMRLEVTTEADKVAAAVAQDLVNRRRGEILETGVRSGMHVVVAEAPLAELRGYSKALRSMSSGRALLGMELERYDVMEEREQIKAIEEVTGFAP